MESKQERSCCDNCKHQLEHKDQCKLVGEIVFNEDGTCLDFYPKESVDKQEPNLEGKGVRDVLCECCEESDACLFDRPKDVCKFIGDKESRIRAIIRKEVVEEFWQEICKLYWNGNVEVDDATVTVMELVDIRNKILAKGE